MNNNNENKFYVIAYLEIDPLTPVVCGSFPTLKAARACMTGCVDEWYREILDNTITYPEDAIIAIDITRAIIRTPDKRGCKWYVTDEFWDEIELTYDLISDEIIIPDDVDIKAEMSHFLAFNAVSESTNLLTHYFDILDMLIERENPQFVTFSAWGVLTEVSDEIWFETFCRIFGDTAFGKYIINDYLNS